MSEQLPSTTYEMTGDGLAQRLDDMFVQYAEFTRDDWSAPCEQTSAVLLLEATTGERMFLQKAILGSQPVGHFFQDLLLTVTPGASRRFPHRQLDFNFNQFGDGDMRRRTLSPMKTMYKFGTEPDSDADDSQPVSELDVIGAMRYLDGATVIAVNGGLVEQVPAVVTDKMHREAIAKDIVAFGVVRAEADTSKT